MVFTTIQEAFDWICANGGEGNITVEGKQITGRSLSQKGRDMLMRVTDTALHVASGRLERDTISRSRPLARGDWAILKS